MPYHVVSSANDMALETHPDHNFILVLTPERLLYLLNDRSDFILDYLFIDEAHKVGALTVIDAVHYAPHRPIDVKAIDTDFLLCSVYKFCGPHVGVLYVKKELRQ